MKTVILESEKITKEIALQELYNGGLTVNEQDELLDIITEINKGYTVYDVITNNGNYLFFIKGLGIINTKKRIAI